MRLTRGGIRELHWHLDAEWAYVTSGACRITTIDGQGRANVEDVEEGGLWYFPPGLPHSLQGVGPDGCEFIICFDDGKASEFNTLLLTDWMAHTPPEALAMNFGVPAETFSKIPLHDLYIFQGEMPGPIEASRARGAGLARRTPARIRPSGSPTCRPSRRRAAARCASPIQQQLRGRQERSRPRTSRCTPAACARCTGIPNADEWTYIIAGQGELTVFNTGPNVVTQNFNPGDVGYIKRALRPLHPQHRDDRSRLSGGVPQRPASRTSRSPSG